MKPLVSQTSCIGRKTDNPAPVICCDKRPGLCITQALAANQSEVPELPSGDPFPAILFITEYISIVKQLLCLMRG